MKKIAHLLLILCLPTYFMNCAQEKSNQQQNPKASATASKDAPQGAIVTIAGTLKNAQKTKVYLKKFMEKGFQAVDSMQIEGKNFQLKYKVEETDIFQLNIFGSMNIPLVLNPKNPNVTINISNQGAENNYEIKGSDDSNYYIAIDKLYASLAKQQQTLQKEFEKTTTSEQEKEGLRNQYMAMMKENAQKLKVIIDTIQPSIVGLVALQGLEYEEHREFIDRVLAKYEKDLPASIYTKRITKHFAPAKKKYEASAHVSEGKTAPEIELIDPKGELVKLSSLRGKVVLIDFWASWCGPCRAENPNVVRLYDTYKDKGFEILGVSLDNKKDAWLKAIEQDKLTWKHISDLKGWQSEGAKTYVVQSIPQTFLLDKEGKIIARNLRGKALEDKLAEVLK